MSAELTKPTVLGEPGFCFTPRSNVYESARMSEVCLEVTAVYFR